MNYESTVTAESGDEFVPADPGEGEGPVVSRKKIALIALAATIALAVIYYFLQAGDDGAAANSNPISQVPVVSVISPGRATIVGEIEATGTLAARRTLPVGSVGEGGRVVSVPVDAGDWVRQGQVLASIDRSVQVQQISAAEASVSVAQADANLAQSNLDRALQLVERGFISKADVDRLTATRDAAVARVRVARAQLGELRALTARLNIYAPASGLILERNVEPGQTVSGGGTALFTIAKGGEMELQALVSEEELSQLAVGVEAQVVPVGTSKVLTGQVWQLSPTINEQSRQGMARIALAYDPALRPGGFASATIASGTVVAPMLPESAIQNDEQGSFVYVVKKDNTVERRAVTTGLVTSNGIAITDGIDGSEKIVMRAGGFLAPGDKVKPQLAGQSD
jgi:RND family efflux transporter MFP subunit